MISKYFTITWSYDELVTSDRAPCLKTTTILYNVQVSRRMCVKIISVPLLYWHNGI